jgi:hypothetical protein
LCPAWLTIAALLSKRSLFHVILRRWIAGCAVPGPLKVTLAVALAVR